MRTRSAAEDLNEEPNGHEAIERHFVYVFQILRLGTPQGPKRLVCGPYIQFKDPTFWGIILGSPDVRKPSYNGVRDSF